MRLYCLIFSALDGISVKRLSCYMYLLQKIGFNLDYTYSITTRGIQSKNFSRYLEKQVSTGLLQQTRGTIIPSQQGVSYLERCIVSYDEYICPRLLVSMLDKLSDEELYLVCVTDIILQDIIKSRGIDALLKEREFIETSISNLCSAYSKDNFNMTISLLSKIEKECSLDE